jgi:hypothetical protein
MFFKNPPAQIRVLSEKYLYLPVLNGLPVDRVHNTFIHNRTLHLSERTTILI